MHELKQVVSELEAGNLTLSESLGKYEQGVKNLKLCHETLRQTQRKIELLVNLDEDGNLSTTAFDDTASYSGDEEEEVDEEEEEVDEEEEEVDEDDTASLGDEWEDDPTLF